MGYPRKSLICLADTPYYHVVARCVRRAWLCGYDEYAGKDYSHRKYWILHRLRQLAEVFAVDLCAYAIMSNHYHLVLRVDRQRSTRWSQEEVVQRWTKVFARPLLIERWQDGSADRAERLAAEQLIERWRIRLIDISWYMRCLNEHLARRANTEDDCTGRFWEGRFKSQALLDEAGLLTAMVYVDLNPVRAGIAVTPEESAFTSIYQRVREYSRRHQNPQPQPPPHRHSKTPPLFDFLRDGDDGIPALPMRLAEYLQVVDWSGRLIRSDKPGAIKADLPPILVRLRIEPGAWQAAMRPGGNVFGRAIGRLKRLNAHAMRLGQQWVKGLATAQRLYL